MGYSRQDEACRAKLKQLGQQCAKHTYGGLEYIRMRCRNNKKMEDSMETAKGTGRKVSVHLAASAMVARFYIVSGSFGTTSSIVSLRQKFVSCETRSDRIAFFVGCDV
jgi:hypothetical protein